MEAEVKTALIALAREISHKAMSETSMSTLKEKISENASQNTQRHVDLFLETYKKLVNGINDLEKDK